MFHVDSCLYGASEVDRDIAEYAESDVVCIKRVKIQAGARNVRLYRSNLSGFICSLLDPRV